MSNGSIQPKSDRAEDFPPVPIKVWPSHCLVCRKKFVRGDRILSVFNVAGVGFDGETNRQLAAAGPYVEMAHLNCADTQCNGTVLSI